LEQDAARKRNLPGLGGSPCDSWIWQSSNPFFTGAGLDPVDPGGCPGGAAALAAGIGCIQIWLLPSMSQNILDLKWLLATWEGIGPVLEEQALRITSREQDARYAVCTSMFIHFLKGNQIVPLTS
jgi:hypothetical protein